MRIFFLRCIMVLCASWPIATVASNPRIVTYSWPKNMQADQRSHYPVALLQLALAKSGEPITAQPSDFVMTQYRTLKQLELDHGIDVVWTMTNLEREHQLRPVRIPIDRGLIGYRLLAINDDDTERFESFQSVDDIKQLVTVQGIDWPDYQILQSNGFQLTSSNHFDGMYPMLLKHRVQFFARSMTEIWPELTSYANQGVVVAPRWVLHYPAALYFFVRKTDHELAQAIEKGLRIALADGSYKALFLKHFHDAITRADLGNRQVIELKNPLLPPDTPLTQSELWFNPTEGF